jgi:hypothetical protein
MSEPKTEPTHPASCECDGTGRIEMGDPTDSTVENWLEPCPFGPATGMKLSDTQTRALRIAARNGRWWIHGRGGINAARALERRGLGVIEWEYGLPRPERYLAPTAEGRRLVDSWAVT